MASDKPCWTEPPGRRWNGQCKFQRAVSAMPMLAAPGCAVAMRSHTGHQGGVWPMRQPCRVARCADVARPTHEAPGLCEQADGEHTVVPRAHLTAGLDMQPSEGRCNGRAISAAVLHHAPPPEPAMRTARHVDGRQAAHEGLRILARLRVGSGHRQQSPRQRQPLRLGCRCEQPVVVDALEAREQDTLQDVRCNSSQHHRTFCTLMELALPQIFSMRGFLFGKRGLCVEAGKARAPLRYLRANGGGGRGRTALGTRASGGG